MPELKTLIFYFFQFYYSTFAGIYQRYTDYYADKSLLTYASSVDGILAILFFTLGSLFLFLSNQFMNISSFALISVFVYTVLKINYKLVNPIAQVFDVSIRNLLPENILPFFGLSEEHALGYIVLSVVVALVALMFLKFSKYILILGLLLVSFVSTNRLFAKSQDAPYEFSIIHAVLTIGLTIIIYMLIMYLKDIVFMGIFSFVGAAMFIVVVSMLFNYPVNFAEYYLNIFSLDFLSREEPTNDENSNKNPKEADQSDQPSDFYLNLAIHFTTAGLGFIFQKCIVKSSK